MVTVVLAGKGARMETEDSSRAVGLQQARSYLRNADPVLARLIDDRPDFDPRAWRDNAFGLPPTMDLFGALLFQITGQQLSVLATRRTLARIEAPFGGHLPSATELLGADPAKLREAGLSRRKIGTLRDLAGRLSDGRLDPKVLSGLPDDHYRPIHRARHDPAQLFLLTVRDRPWARVRRASPPICIAEDPQVRPWRGEPEWAICAWGCSARWRGPSVVTSPRLRAELQRGDRFAGLAARAS